MVVLLRALPAGDELTFSDLQERLALSPGNLSTHLRKLEDAGYVAVAKTFRDRMPVTSVSLTERGRAAHRAYASALTYYLDGSAAEDMLRTEGSS
jgi:DNA-binding MarR family transcriptional regulator